MKPEKLEEIKKELQEVGTKYAWSMSEEDAYMIFRVCNMLYNFKHYEEMKVK